MTLASSICPDSKPCAPLNAGSHEPHLHFDCCHFHASPRNRQYCLICLPRIYPYANTGLHTYRFSQNPDGINWTLEKQLRPVRAEWPSQLNKQCHGSVLTQTRAPTQTLYSPKVCCHFFALFVKALFNPFRALPQLLNGSCTVSCLSLAFFSRKRFVSFSASQATF